MINGNKKSSTKTFFKLCLFIITIIVVTFWWKYTIFITLTLIVLSVLIMFVDSFKYIKTFIVAGLVGALAESIAIQAGGWTYAINHLLGIPIWLPILWGMASIIILSISRFLGEIR